MDAQHNFNLSHTQVIPMPDLESLLALLAMQRLNVTCCTVYCRVLRVPETAPRDCRKVLAKSSSGKLDRRSVAPNATLSDAVVWLTYHNVFIPA